MFELLLALLLMIGVVLYRIFSAQTPTSPTHLRTRPPATAKTDPYLLLLTQHQGNRQQVELEIVAAQCRMPGHTRNEVIHILAFGD